MDKHKESETQSVIFDCNVWITDFFKKESELRNKITNNKYQVILTSYMVVEILRVLRRLSTRLSISYTDLETRFWEICSLTYIKTDFKEPFSESLISEVRRIPEFRIIAKILDLEVKDVPYLVAAFQHTAILVSNDLRSLVDKRNLIENNLRVKIRTTTEFLALDK
jgi:predicted nucleic acid-binding protein